MDRPAVLLLEDNPAEATLAESALLVAGCDIVALPEHAVVAILGRDALREYRGKLRIPAVAILHDPSALELSRARDCGVRVYERPQTWEDYTALVGRLLSELPTRKG